MYVLPLKSLGGDEKLILIIWMYVLLLEISAFAIVGALLQLQPVIGSKI